MGVFIRRLLRKIGINSGYSKEEGLNKLIQNLASQTEYKVSNEQAAELHRRLVADSKQRNVLYKEIEKRALDRVLHYAIKHLEDDISWEYGSKLNKRFFIEELAKEATGNVSAPSSLWTAD